MANLIEVPAGFTKVVVPSGKKNGKPGYSNLRASSRLSYDFMLDHDWKKLADYPDRSTHKLLGIRDCLNIEKIQLGLRVNTNFRDGSVRFRPVHYQHRSSMIIYDEVFDTWIETGLIYTFSTKKLPNNMWQSEITSRMSGQTTGAVTKEPVTPRQILICKPYITGVYVELGSSPSPVELTTYIKINEFY